MRRSTSSPSIDIGRTATGGGSVRGPRPKAPSGAAVWIASDSPPDAFPDPRHAPGNRPLAVGGDLHPQRLIHAYRRGIFPWYSEDGPILWWSPDPRTVIVPAELRISHRLRRRLRRNEFEVTWNTAFESVMQGCAAPRRGGGSETWITPEMRQAYLSLHAAGHALSIECWRDGALAGGIYGVVVGRVFCGESMFSRVPDASKVALASLCAESYVLIDCQVPNEHLLRLGARLVPRHEFLTVLDHFTGPLEVVPGTVDGHGHPASLPSFAATRRILRKAGREE